MTKAAKAAKPKMRPDPDVYPGKMFGHLRVERRVSTKDGPRIWVTCYAPTKEGGQCGKKFQTRKQYLTRKPPMNPTTHCGCLLPKAEYKYERVCWHSMHLRTEYEGHEAYKQYGGRGIKVCQRWQKSREDGLGFQHFLEDMGPCPNPHKDTVDRIDNDKGYSPENCRWATKKEQRQNQRRNT